MTELLFFTWMKFFTTMNGRKNVGYWISISRAHLVHQQSSKTVSIHEIHERDFKKCQMYTNLYCTLFTRYGRPWMIWDTSLDTSCFLPATEMKAPFEVTPAMQHPHRKLISVARFHHCLAPKLRLTINFSRSETVHLVYPYRRAKTT